MIDAILGEVWNILFTVSKMFGAWLYRTWRAALRLDTVIKSARANEAVLLPTTSTGKLLRRLLVDRDARPVLTDLGIAAIAPTNTVLPEEIGPLIRQQQEASRRIAAIAG